MKKLTLLLFALLATAACHAQKRYVTLTTVQASSPYAILSGDVPSTMKTEYYYPEVAGSIFSWTGDLLNQLGDEGFKVNRMTSYVNPSNNYQYVIYVLSRQGATPPPSDAIEKVTDIDEQEPREVARYNLQGLPVSDKEKGIQIIVYSNYTTKTIIKE